MGRALEATFAHRNAAQEQNEASWRYDRPALPNLLLLLERKKQEKQQEDIEKCEKKVRNTSINFPAHSAAYRTSSVVQPSSNGASTQKRFSKSIRWVFFNNYSLISITVTSRDQQRKISRVWDKLCGVEKARGNQGRLRDFQKVQSTAM